MPKFSVVPKPPGFVDYQAAAQRLSKTLAAGLLQAATAANLADDDPLYAVLVAVAELHQASFEAQTVILKATLEPRSIQNQRMNELLLECAATVNLAQKALTDSAQGTTALAQSLETALRQVQETDRDARARESQALQVKLQELNCLLAALEQTVRPPRNRPSAGPSWILLLSALVSAAVALAFACAAHFGHWNFW